MDEKKIPLVARLALKLKWMTLEQLASVADKIDPQQPIGDLLVAEGFVDERQRQRLESLKLELLAKHRDRRASQKAGSDRASSDPNPDPELKKASRPDVIHAVAAQSAEVVSPVATQSFGDEAGESTKAPESAPSLTEARKPVRAPVESQGEVSTELDSESLGLGLSLQSASSTTCDALDEILRQAVQSGASDIHIHSEGRLAFRMGGELIAEDDRHLDAEAAERLVVSALSEKQCQEIRRFGELDFCLEREGIGRFRANAY